MPWLERSRITFVRTTDKSCGTTVLLAIRVGLTGAPKYREMRRNAVVVPMGTHPRPLQKSLIKPLRSVRLELT